MPLRLQLVILWHGIVVLVGGLVVLLVVFARGMIVVGHELATAGAEGVRLSFAPLEDLDEACIN